MTEMTSIEIKKEGKENLHIVALSFVKMSVSAREKQEIMTSEQSNEIYWIIKNIL
jgi:hypothetical protein